MGAIGIFLTISAVIVLFPVLLQVRMGESSFRQIWGYLIFVLGLLIAAFADSNVGQTRSTQLAVAGVITALIGLILQSRLPKSKDEP